MILTFEISKTAKPGYRYISIDYDKSATMNHNLDLIELIPGDGCVIIAERVVGDADGDGVLNLKDVAILRRMLAGWEGHSINDANADADGDGKVTLKDAVLIERYLADWEVTLK